MSPTFVELGVPADLDARLRRQSITEPFPIQTAALPDALAGRDVCGRAPTGSGKTLAFGIALVVRVGDASPSSPRALVLVPTRELAVQVAEVLAYLAPARGRRVVTVYGGAGYEPQRKALRAGAEIVVATPGRLEDLVARGDVRLRDVDLVVVDEADRMADMGFLPAVRRLLDATRPDRQTMLFSATLDGAVDVLVKRYQKSPVRHDVCVDDDGAEVDHVFWDAPRDSRVRLTAGLIDRHDRVIVFCRTKHGADRLTKQLRAAGISATPIHGNRSQAQRERALTDFRNGKVQALIATDVAARGIHVDAVPCVVHFDPAADEKDYLHRSGRTGRAGATGTVVTLVGDEHRAAIRSIQRALGFAQKVDRADSMPALRSAPLAPEPAAPVRPMRPARPANAGRPFRGKPPAGQTVPARKARPEPDTGRSGSPRPWARPAGRPAATAAQASRRRRAR